MSNPHLKNPLLFLFMPFVLFWASAAHAASQEQPLGDLSLPIQIQSDQASFEHVSRQAKHMGNVIMTQGTNELHSDTLTLHKDLENNMNVIIAIGNPATFKGMMRNDPAPVTGTAEKITYYPAKNLLVFEGNATFHHQQDKFKGPSLSYQIDKQLVTAAANNRERPTIVIQPRQKK